MTGNSSQTVATCATEHILKVLETEVHEKTLVLALEMLSKWGAKFTEIPKKLLDWFDKGMSTFCTLKSVLNCIFHKICFLKIVFCLQI